MTGAPEGRQLPEQSGAGEAIAPGPESGGLTWGWATDTGRRRARNEDAVLADRTAFFVADGMGGHLSGDVAARTVLAEMAVLAGRPEVTAEDCAGAVRTAAKAIDEIDSRDRRPAGTTLTGALVTCSGGAPYWLVVNVGDSRTYLWRGGRLDQITVDHSAVREMLDAGEITAAEARTHPERNIITRAVGGGVEPRADVWMVPRHPGDVLVAVSDGVTGEIDDDELTDLVRWAADPGALARSLVVAAVERGGRDNASAVAVALAGEPAETCDATQDLPRPGPAAHDRAGNDRARNDWARNDRAGNDRTHNSMPRDDQEDRR